MARSGFFCVPTQSLYLLASWNYKTNIDFLVSGRFMSPFVHCHVYRYLYHLYFLAITCLLDIFHKLQKNILSFSTKLNVPNCKFVNYVVLTCIFSLSK